jgi:hypothetical protein
LRILLLQNKLLGSVLELVVLQIALSLLAVLARPADLLRQVSRCGSPAAPI